MKVLYVGGTGTISWSCVAESARQGADVYVLNRGRAHKRRLPEGVKHLTADVQDGDAVLAAVGDTQFDSVVNFLSFGEKDAAAAVELWSGRTAQYIHVSSASIYHKPVHRVPIVESTPRHNLFLEYARDKIAAEEVLAGAYEESAFPVTIVRPSHTYDDAHPPLPGAWTAWDRIARGAELVVPGDGTSLWTLTHAADFAVGLVGLVGNWGAIGESFHITSDEVLTWDDIYDSVARVSAVPARLLHLSSELLPVLAPDWLWSTLILGDLAHSAVFDNAKIRRFVPAFRPAITWSEGVRRLAGWRDQHPEETRPDPSTDAVLDRLVLGRHRAAEVLAELAP
ncbi:nucleoside-diphosphate-sugar epimerase [Kribbella sp. VKM Ac-2527]|uniref:Nucleoside-diphosphate-sugar epimerase n=1 Tax=Kribbella caucasensis TaxID=2512215 RepID=A0A4R6KNF6_9ACTN|nr:NAD-dependent epimerase/dehydratase family protein [Kribbella sp. VKM Ac-2527]TDO51640.1 nucleoside-diphosphate-sugar epimerase [Kribbella sp. VKM Ac-2527]